MLAAGNDRLEQKIDAGFEDYLYNVLLELPNNNEESVAAITAIVSREELDQDSVKAFLQRQSEQLPCLDQVPAHLYPMLFEIEKIEASWENCQAFLSSETYDAEILTVYLSRDENVAALSPLPISGGEADISSTTRRAAKTQLRTPDPACELAQNRRSFIQVTDARAEPFRLIEIILNSEIVEID